MEIEKIKPSTANAIIVSVSCFFAALLFIFIKFNQLFIKLDTIKLVGFCLAIVFPFFILNGLLSTIPHKYETDIVGEKREAGFALAGALHTAILYWLFSLCCYFFIVKVWVLLLIGLSYEILVGYSYHKERKNKKEIWKLKKSIENGSFNLQLANKNISE